MTFVRADGVAGNRSDNFPRCENGDKNRHNIKALLKAFWRQHCVFICAARVAACVALEGCTQAAKNATAVVHRGQADRDCRLLERPSRRRLLPTDAFRFEVCGHGLRYTMTRSTRDER